MGQRIRCPSARLPLAFGKRSLFGIAPKSNQKGLAPDAVVWFASGEPNYPALLARTGLLRQYIHVLLRKRGDPSPRPFGLIRHGLRCSAPRTVPSSMNPCIPALHRRDRSLKRAFGANACSGFCGGMPPKRGPVRRGEGAQEKPEGARARCARVRWCTRTYTQRTSGAPSRTRRVGCPEGAPSGVCFLWLLSLHKQRE